METEESERVVVVKPVPSRPLRNISEIVAGGIDSKPTELNSENAVKAIRPKAVRLKPIVLPASPDVITSQAMTSRQSVSSVYNKDPGSNGKLNVVVYKPVAKPVPKAAISILTHKFGASQQQTQPRVEGRTQSEHQNEQNFRSQVSTNRLQSISSNAETVDSHEGSSKLTSQRMEESKKCLSASTSAHRPCYDGYNWRKYGQKQVKGSDCPRGYYKCTYPSCPAKKKVERSFDGKIAEIVYNGDHNHPKLLPPTHNCSATQGLGLASGRTSQGANSSFSTKNIDGKNESSEGGLQNHNVEGLPGCFNYHGKVPPTYDPAVMTNTDGGNSEKSSVHTGKLVSKGTEGKSSEPGSKKRKNEKQAIEAVISVDARQGPPTSDQNSTDSEISGDGFRWRKYGQKVVNGNIYPRSYYRCTTPKCNARKHVEKASDDPTFIITTYEGKHNHDVLLTNTNSANTKEDSSITKTNPRLQTTASR